MSNGIDGNLSSFLESIDVIRTDDLAEIIVDYIDNNPIRLIGFVSDPVKSDFEIGEEGYYYYQDLKRIISGVK